MSSFSKNRAMSLMLVLAKVSWENSRSHAEARARLEMTNAEPPTKPSYVRVIIDRSIHRELDYAIPESFADKIGIGSRVRVPFRERSALATVVGLLETSDASGIRPIEALVGDTPILSEELITLARWMSTYYCCPIETVMRSLLPQVIRRAELSWKKQLFVSAAKEITAEEIEKLRRRAPRQAELL